MPPAREFLATSGRSSPSLTQPCIARVEVLAKHERQPLIQARGIVVEWRPGHLVDDDEYDLNFDIDAHNDPGDDVFDADNFDPIDDELDVPAVRDVVPHAQALVQGAPDDNGNDDELKNEFDDAVDPGAEPGAEIADAANPGAEIADDVSYGEDKGAHPHDSDDDDDGDDDGGDLVDIPDGNVNEGTTPGNAARYNLRPRVPDAAQQRFNDVMDEPHSTQAYYPPTQLMQVDRHNLRAVAFEYMLHQLTEPGKNPKEAEDAFLVEFAYMLTQMTANAGIKKHRKPAEASLMAEFAQMEDLSVYEPIDPATLSKKQRQAALRALNLIKEKRDGRLKSRTVADGRPQRLLYDKSETTSPTVSTDALMLSIMVDAYEGRDVATADVVGAYLKDYYMDEFVVMKFSGASVDILCKMNENYKKFVVVEGNSRVLYVKLIKAIYGCVKSALLWFELFTLS